MLHEATLKARETKLGPDHPHTLNSRSNLARAYLTAGRTSEAIALHETTLKLRESKLGRDHPQTIYSRSELGAAYWTVGRLDRSVPLFEDSLKLHESKLGPDHVNTLITMVNLGSNYTDAGRLEEGTGLMEQAIVRARTRYGSIPPSLEFAEAELAIAYDRARRFDKSEPLYRVLPERGAPAVRPGRPADGHGHVPARIEPDPAAEVARGRNDPPGVPGDPREGDPLMTGARYHTMSSLGDALLAQGKHIEAEPLIVEGYEGLKAREARIPSASKFRLREASGRLVRLYEAWGKPDQATAWKAKLGLTELPADVFAPP